jgi:hypothetical protein
MTKMSYVFLVCRAFTNILPYKAQRLIFCDFFYSDKKASYLDSLYSISYLHLTWLGAVTLIVVGILASLLTGKV